jgi:hypothetical protein
MAAGGAAMALSAGGDKKGGQQQKRFFSEKNCRQSHVIANYGDVTACNTMCFMP